MSTVIYFSVIKIVNIQSNDKQQNTYESTYVAMYNTILKFGFNS